MYYLDYLVNLKIKKIHCSELIVVKLMKLKRLFTFYAMSALMKTFTDS